MKVKNKHVLITGANRGMGSAFVDELLSRGAQVTMINRTTAQRTNSDVREILSDLSQIKDFSQFLVQEEIEDVDVLINNAGLLVGGLLEEQDSARITKMTEINLHVPILLTQALLPSFIKKGSGLIVNNASVSGIMTFPCATTYAATKAGLVSFSNGLREELLETGVKVCVLMTPGVQTKMYDQIFEAFTPYLDLSFLKSMAPEKWAKIVIDGIEKGKSEIRPKGTENIGLHLAQKTPMTFRKIMRSRFDRYAKKEQS